MREDVPRRDIVNARGEELRVLVFGRYADENFGGIERYVLELARALHGKVAFWNIVAARGGPPDVPLPFETVYAHPVAEFRGTPICPTMPFHARRLHRREAFDIIHLQFPADPLAHLAAVSLPRAVRRVITWHSDIVRQTGLLKLYRPFLDSLLRSADAIILPTPAHLTASQLLKNAYPTARFEVIPFGFDFTAYRDRPPAAGEIRKKIRQRYLVFALGRHVYYKGFDVLIRAMRDVPHTALILGGLGPLTSALKTLARDIGVADRIEFAGRIPEAILPAYYHACDVFCMPSTERSEAFGIVQLEAMAAGKPVVSSKLGNGVNWVNQDGITGLAVPPGDPAALAVAINLLLADAELRGRLGAAGRTRAFSEFTATAMANRTLAVYRSVLSNSGASRPSEVA